MMVRSLVCVPPPQLAEQSIGQPSVLQSRSIFSGGHAEPFTGCTMMERSLVCVPPPQLAEHSPSTQSDTSQSAMNTLNPSNRYNSPRIFSRAQISDVKAFLFVQHSVIVRWYSSFNSTCCAFEMIDNC